MSSYILFIFEGEKTEQLIFNSLTKYFLNDSAKTKVCSYWCSDIYTLYESISDDPDLDTFALLKEQTSDLPDIPRDKVAEIYLIFDYDGHATMASDDKIKNLLTLFDNETNSGKLYISYPMVEAFRHLHDNVEFQAVSALISECVSYKNIVHLQGDDCYKNYSKLSSDNWKKILEEHCKKLHYLMTNDFSLPCQEVSQMDIFRQQERKHITPKQEVAVLSAFPILIADYYGYQELPSMVIKTNE